ncbi:MAG: pyridoxal-phosphate dependent enzyme [Desulfurococcaceae archaeon]|nr:pyridoxal-phosphate dependent enzyme [Desulfurococcaceae archaeon]
MYSVELVPVSKLACGDVDLERFLELVREILSRGGVTTTVAVDPKTGAVVYGSELCATLAKLGTRYVPVSYGRVEEVFVPLEALGFFDEVRPSTYRVFLSSEELLYKNWPTPLVRLSRASVGGRVVWAKLEGYNPWSMSVKDRVGWYMYRKALERLGRVERLVEATSTNTGLAIAAVSNIYGSRLKAYIPSTVSRTGEFLLKLFGTEVVRSQRAVLTVELIDEVEEEARTSGAVHLNQFYNDANLEVHLRYTAKELELQLREAGVVPKAIIGGLGTSGHLSALALYFKSRFRGVRVYGVVPRAGTSIQGIRRVESGMRWVHLVDLDGVVEVSPEEAAEGVLRIVRSEGVLVGLSSGAVYAAYRQLAEGGELEEGDYVLVFPDHGFKYVEQLEKLLKL